MTEKEVGMRPSVLFGVICLVFGILVFIFPQILNYLVASFLVIVGFLAILGGARFIRW